MKNKQKGFIAPLLMVLVAVLLVGGGAYVYVQTKQTDQSATVTPTTTQTTPTAQTPTTTAVVQSFCHTFNTDLTVGSRVDVSDLRKVLSLNGFSQVGSAQNPFKSASGPDFNENDATNVVKFQAKYGVRQTGNVDSITRAKLNSLYGCSLNQNQLNQSAQQVFAPDVSPVHDADIRANLSSIQIDAEIYYGGDGGHTYGVTAFTSDGVCGASAVAKALASTQTANGGIAPICNSSAQAYAVSSPFFSDRTKFWCVDSTGSNIQTATPLGTKTVCK